MPSSIAARVPLAPRSIFSRAPLQPGQATDKRLDGPHRILRADIFVERLRQQQRLGSVVAGDLHHAEILSLGAPRRNPWRSGFHMARFISVTNDDQR